MWSPPNCSRPLSPADGGSLPAQPSQLPLRTEMRTEEDNWAQSGRSSSWKLWKEWVIRGVHCSVLDVISLGPPLGVPTESDKHMGGESGWVTSFSETLPNPLHVRFYSKSCRCVYAPGVRNPKRGAAGGLPTSCRVTSLCFLCSLSLSPHLPSPQDSLWLS